MKAFIFHGTMGSPTGNWFPWVENELVLKGWDVSVPSFPTPENQSLDSWLDTFQNCDNAKNADVFIGHSLGATFILNLMVKKLIQPSQVVLVSTVTKSIDIEEFDVLNSTFIQDDFNWDSIKKTATNISIIHGDNDPYVPLSHAQELSKQLQTPLKIIEDGGHLNSETDYTTFPYLLDIINES